MRIANLDRRVQIEARKLVRAARKLPAKPELAQAIVDVERALAGPDLRGVRAALPALDELVTDGKPSTWVDQVVSIVVLLAIVLGIRAFVVEAFEIPSASMYPTLEINDRIFVSKLPYGLRIPYTRTKLFARVPDRGSVLVFIYPCDRSRDYIKRLIGLPGDTVEVRCNVVYINGKALPRELVDATCSYDDRGDDGLWSTKTCRRYQETVGSVTHQVFQDAEPQGRDVDEADLDLGATHDFPARTSPKGPSCAGEQAIGQIVETKPEAAAKACEPQLHYVVPEGRVFMMGDNRDNSNDSRVWGTVSIDDIKGNAMFIWLAYRTFDPGGIHWSRMGSLVH